MIPNLSKSYTITLGSTSPITLNPAVVGFDFKQPLYDLGEALIWRGKVELKQCVKFLFNHELSPEQNLARWRSGQLLTLTIDGVQFLKLYTTQLDYDEDDDAAELQATCVLGWLNNDRPLKRNQNFGINAIAEQWGATLSLGVVPWYSIAANTLIDNSNGLLTSADVITAGIPSFLSNTITAIGSSRVAGYAYEPPDDSANPVERAANLAGNYGYAVYSDRLGKVRFTKYPVNNYTPVLSFAREEVTRFTLKFDSTFEPLPKTIKVVGLGVTGTPREAPSNTGNLGEFTLPPNEAQEPAPLCDGISYPITEEILDANSNVVEIRTTDRPLISANSVYRHDTVVAQQSRILGGDNDSLITAKETLQQTFYRPDGYPTAQTDTILEPRGLYDPEDPQNTSLITSQIITTEWGYTANGLLRSVTTTTQSPGFVVFGSLDAGEGQKIASQQFTTYTQLGCETWRETITDYAPIALVAPDRAENNFDDSPYIDGEPVTRIINSLPNPPFQELTQPAHPEVVDYSFFVETSDEDDDAPGREETIERTNVNSPEQAAAIASLIATLQQQRRFAREVVRGVDTWTLTNYAPFQVEDIHQGRYVRDGFGVIYSDGELGFAYTGNKRGTIPTVTRPVIRASVGGTSLAIASIPNMSFIPNAEIAPVFLSASGGTPPYTFTSSTLPTGLSLSVAGTLTGTPTTSGITAATFTVEDSVSATDDTTASITISVPAEDPHYWEAPIGGGALIISGDAIIPDPMPVILGSTGGLIAQQPSETYVGAVLIESDGGALVLQQPSVTEINEAPGAIPTVGLVHQWNFNSKTDTGEGQFLISDQIGSATLQLPYSSDTEAPIVVGKINNAIDMEGSDLAEVQNVANIDVLGDSSFTIYTWVYLESVAASRDILQWSDLCTLKYDYPSDRFVFTAIDSGGIPCGSVSANNFGAPSSGVWYLIRCSHNSTSNTIAISVNNGTKNTASTTAALGSTTLFLLGCDRIDCTAIYALDTDSTTDDEIWNSGDGAEIT